MQEMKTFNRKPLALLLISFFTMFVSYWYASDSVASIFTSQSSSGLWSSNSLISVDSNLSYVNKWENSSIIWNYFTGYYYDSVLGYFEVDTSPNQSENVRIIWSTGACPAWYGYKLGWYAYSEVFWYVDFDYDSDIFVYYCVVDNELYGHAYNSFLGFQNFEGITFDIDVEATIIPTEEPTWTGAFVNDTSEILEEEIWWEAWKWESDDSNFNHDSIQNDLLEFDGKYESLFYIIK